MQHQVEVHRVPAQPLRAEPSDWMKHCRVLSPDFVEPAFAITLLYRGRGCGHYDLIVPPTIAERLLAAGDVSVEWVSAAPWT